MQRKEILNEIENNPSILQEIDKKYLSDEEFMLSILEMKPILAYRFIDDSLLSNKNFIEKALLIENNTNINNTKQAESRPKTGTFSAGNPVWLRYCQLGHGPALLPT